MDNRLPPFKTKDPVVALAGACPKLLSALMLIFPPEIVVVPEYVLVPPKTSIPAPDFVKFADPVITPL